MEQVINYDYLIKCRAATPDDSQLRNVIINPKHIISIEEDAESKMIAVVTTQNTYIVLCDLETFTLPLQGQYIVREVNQ